MAYYIGNPTTTGAEPPLLMAALIRNGLLYSQTPSVSSRLDFLSALSRKLKRARPERRSFLFPQIFCKQNLCGSPIFRKLAIRLPYLRAAFFLSTSFNSLP